MAPKHHLTFDKTGAILVLRKRGDTVLYTFALLIKTDVKSSATYGSLLSSSPMLKLFHTILIECYDYIIELCCFGTI